MKDRDLPSVSGVICGNNKQKYLDYKDSDSDSEYSINLASDNGSEDSSEIQLSGSESEDSDDGTIQSALSWMKINMNNPPHAPRRFQFSSDPKVLANISEEDGPLEFFSLFMDRDLQELIVNETNRFASQHPSTNLGKSRSCIPTNVDEMMLFFALSFLQCLVKKPDYHWYWSKRESINMPVF
ncbi:hypothetical protein AVEN_53028-1 [Araneus ventricosus]|uniref:PiggyBac transposable element-derived protein domain-containing protein n=1 Tax=Araneus ventricosus TaxID=182803 RepID=A0A4Y2KXN1_ARAVE|nr:hypothetical protein AVEN_53028-1 [Araneus ventricosus]